jgi:NADH-quinone oxidoreductase subunit J
MTALAPLFAAGALGFFAFALARAHAVEALLGFLAGVLLVASACFALGAGFAGAWTLVLHAAGIVVLFVFAVAGLDLSPNAVTAERRRRGGAASLAVPVLAGAAVAAALGAAMILAPERGGDHAAGPEAVGATLFGPWAVLVEVASFVLLAALVVARGLGRGEGDD